MPPAAAWAAAAAGRPTPHLTLRSTRPAPAGCSCGGRPLPPPHQPSSSSSHSSRPRGVGAAAGAAQAACGCSRLAARRWTPRRCWPTAPGSTARAGRRTGWVGTGCSGDCVGGPQGPRLTTRLPACPPACTLCCCPWPAPHLHACVRACATRPHVSREQRAALILKGMPSSRRLRRWSWARSRQRCLRS